MTSQLFMIAGVGMGFLFCSTVQQDDADYPDYKKINEKQWDAGYPDRFIGNTDEGVDKYHRQEYRQENKSLSFETVRHMAIIKKGNNILYLNLNLVKNVIPCKKNGKGRFSPL